MSERLRLASQPPIYCTKREIRVRYADTDQMGVAYYSNYLVWFEVGRSELCRQQGFSYAEMESKTKVYLAVVEAYCRYHAPAFYDEILEVFTWIDSLRKRALSFQYQIVKKDTGVLVASGYTTHVILDKNGKPKTLPEEYADRLKQAVPAQAKWD